MIVDFIGVGMDDMSWQANIDELSYESLYRELKRKGAVMSQSVDFTYDDELKTGEIFVGIFRKVGSFKITP